MPRPARGTEALERARRTIREARSVEELRQAQALVLPLDHGLSLEQTARAIGLSVAWTCRLRARFIEGRAVLPPEQRSRGGRRRALLTPAQEAQVIAPFLARAARGAPLVVRHVQLQIERRAGQPVALSTVYRMLKRHGWSRSG